MKKLALFLALVLCFSLMAPFAVFAEEEVDISKPFKPESETMTEFPERTPGVDCYEVIENGGAEMLEAGGTKIYGWGWTSHVGRDNTYLGCGFLDISNDAHTGEQAVHINVGDGQKCNLGPSGTVIPGETYEVTWWSKRLKDGGTAQLEARFSGSYKGVATSYNIPRVKVETTVADGWVQSGLRFVAPPYSTSLWVDLCFSGPGEILWDDITFRCITTEMPVPEMPDKKPAIESIEIEDSSFENATVGQLIDTVPGWDEVIGSAKISDKYAHTGTKSVDLYTEDGSKDAIGIRYLTGLVEGATYQVSTWLMNPSELKIDMGYWMHWCSEETYSHDTTVQLGQEKPRWSVVPNQTWAEYRAEFVVPKGAKSAMLYFRHRLCPGSIFMDDVEIYMVKGPGAIRANTDEVFYYTEWETGKVTCEPHYLMGDRTKARAEFNFLGLNNEVLHSATITDLSHHVDYEFPTSLMAQKGERYHVSMKVYDDKGELVQEELFPVFRYDRPTYLGADGIFRKNGKEVPFIMGSGLNMNVIDQHPEKGGITVAQLNADNPKLGFTQKERLDAYYAQGMFVILNLYSGVKSGGHPDQIDTARRIVEENKDHPALLGYKLIDEPYQKNISDEEMIAGYKMVRDLDPDHPVYIDDSPAGSYSWLFRYCDIFECDYYSGSPSNQTNVMDQVMEASKGRKPFSVLLQFFQQVGYFPTLDQLRHMTYQAFFSGAYGYSYHTLGVDGTDGITTKGLFLPEWKDTVEKWAPWERDFALGCFVTGTYKFVNYGRTDDYIWGTFTDGTDLYAIALNRSKDMANKVDIPLQDGEGVLKVGAFTAEAVAGKTGTTSGDGTLSLELAPWEASVWKITSSAPFAVDHLKDTSFNDIIYYPWAYNAITTLEEKGIVNRVSEQWYGPGQNITRGDYAMFLVRTLGLTEGADSENFADVDPNAEYAKELAIGKAAGIINGVGDNKFNPKAQITRQDMMTMTSRALKLAGAADLGSFSDAGLIADYASAHVAAMVADGLIKGNADGTINPLGNTTRAEAAVIMQRLLNK